jgi:predicted RNA-binding protein
VADHEDRPNSPQAERGDLVFSGGEAMCEAIVYLAGDGQEREIMRDVMLMQPEGDAWLLVTLLGEQKLVRGTIRKLDFLKHTVHLSRPKESSTAES